MIICITGVPGSGKTTIAELLKAKLEKEGKKVYHLTSDMVGSEIFTEKYTGMLGNTDIDYSDKELDTIYRILYFSFEQGLLIDNNLVIITDGMYRKASQRLILRSIADKFEVPFHLVKTDVEPEEAKKRLYQRAQEGGIGGWVNPSEYEMPYDGDLIKLKNDKDLYTLQKKVNEMSNFNS